ncbi:MAG: tetratricopeptide repeat protein, partial [Burkholderiales bacterium]|nr:tetratricopeptide repeat protein [Burkholderiales bacterium]
MSAAADDSAVASGKAVGATRLSLPDAVRRGVALHRSGRLEEAEAVYGAILVAAPDQFDALHLLGVIEAQRDRPEAAWPLIERALAVNPGSAPALGNAANVLNRLSRFDESLVMCERALAVVPSDAQTLNTRGLALRGLRRHEESLASFDAAVARDPRLAIAWSNRGLALHSLTRHEQALASLDRALAIEPKFAEALFNRGNVLGGVGRRAEAAASYTRALALRPDHVVALEMRGYALHCLGRNDEAAADFARAVALAPERTFAHCMLLLMRMHQCDWHERDAMAQRLVAAVRDGGQGVEPFVFVVSTDSATDQLACTRLAVRERIAAAGKPLWRGERYAHSRIRVAYLSADFREHAMAYLITELLERHDRSRFEIIGVSWGPDEATVARRRIVNAFDRFIDVRVEGDGDVARRLREQEIDIAIDLMGYTHNGRTGIFAQRPAPVQVNYLGYPGTLGADYIDYIVADATVIPEGEEVHYAERVVRLPDSYQANDRQR